MRSTLLAVLGIATAAAPAAAQMPDGYRDVILRKLALEQRLLLAMADSMPDRLYTDKATPAQRSFGEQLYHAANAVVYIGAQYSGVTRPTLPDSAAAVTTRAGARALITAAYGFAEQTVKGQTPAQLNETVNFFRRMEIPRWQMWDEIHLHTIWTAGQVVANFRKHGMAPPGFGFF